MEEKNLSKVIIEETMRDWIEFIDQDVVIVGAGPSGLAASYFLAKAGLKVLVIERRLSFGGGIGGGAMLFNRVVLEEEPARILSSMGAKTKKVDDQLYVIDTAEFAAVIAYSAISAGARVLMGVTVDDVILKGSPPKVEGVAVEWTATQMSGLHVDPLFIRAKATVDATGHDAEVVSVLARKNPSLGIALQGEQSGNVDDAEKSTVENTGKVYPGLYVTGMAVTEVYGLPRMGPIFGAMILSGKKVAQQIVEEIKGIRGLTASGSST